LRSSVWADRDKKNRLRFRIYRTEMSLIAFSQCCDG
jgi:hypothetical protein